jgi:hypothetical protein
MEKWPDASLTVDARTFLSGPNAFTETPAIVALFHR